MGYTKLNDSSGKEIHIHDIIHIGGWRYPRHTVELIDGEYRAVNKHVSNKNLLVDLLKTTVISVIGNTHENPELLNNNE